jgi:hypothetical protein
VGVRFVLEGLAVAGFGGEQVTAAMAEKVFVLEGENRSENLCQQVC